MVSFVIQWTLFYIFKNSSLRKGTQTAQKNLTLEGKTVRKRGPMKRLQGLKSSGRKESAERLYRALWGVKLSVRLKRMRKIQKMLCEKDKLPHRMQNTINIKHTENESIVL